MKSLHSRDILDSVYPSRAFSNHFFTKGGYLETKNTIPFQSYIGRDMIHAGGTQHPSSFFFVYLRAFRGAQAPCDERRQASRSARFFKHEVCHMTTILFYYLHRDEGNWKDHLKAVIDNPNNLPLAEIERSVKSNLIDGEFFIPKRIGLQNSEHADPSDWHEYDSIESIDYDPVFLMTVEELLERLQYARRPEPKVYQVPSFVPIRLVVSWLEFLRETHQSIEIITNACKGKKTVMVFNDGDWEILSETLDLDARSGNFDNELRKDILRALDRAVTIEIDPLKALRRKIPYLETRTSNEIQKAKA